jgi:hypothetical protein
MASPILREVARRVEMDHLSGSASIVMVLGLVAVVLTVVLVVCWIVLPFAVIGMRPLMREQIALTRATNELLKQTNDVLRKIGEDQLNQTQLLRSSVPAPVAPPFPRP